MDNEIARMAKYILRGIPTNDETLMVDEIIEVGVRGGLSLEDEHPQADA